MLLLRFIAIAALFPALASANAPADPTRSDVAVPAPVYQSAFTSYESMQDEQQSPDKVWRQANDEVGRIGGHAGYVKDKETDRTENKAETEVVKKPARPAATPHHHQH